MRDRYRLWQVLTLIAPLLRMTTSQLWRNATPGAVAIHTINRERLLKVQGAVARKGRANDHRLMGHRRFSRRTLLVSRMRKLLQRSKISTKLNRTCSSEGDPWVELWHGSRGLWRCLTFDLHVEPSTRVLSNLVVDAGSRQLIVHYFLRPCLRRPQEQVSFARDRFDHASTLHRLG